MISVDIRHISADGRRPETFLSPSLPLSAKSAQGRFQNSCNNFAIASSNSLRDDYADHTHIVISANRLLGSLLAIHFQKQTSDSGLFSRLSVRVTRRLFRIRHACLPACLPAYLLCHTMPCQSLESQRALGRSG